MHASARPAARTYARARARAPPCCGRPALFASGSAVLCCWTGGAARKPGALESPAGATGGWVRLSGLERAARPRRGWAVCAAGVSTARARHRQRAPGSSVTFRDGHCPQNPDAAGGCWGGARAPGMHRRARRRRWVLAPRATRHAASLAGPLHVQAPASSQPCPLASVSHGTRSRRAPPPHRTPRWAGRTRPARSALCRYVLRPLFRPPIHTLCCSAAVRHAPSSCIFPALVPVLPSARRGKERFETASTYRD